jgi:hypothetical protein
MPKCIKDIIDSVPFDEHKPHKPAWLSVLATSMEVIRQSIIKIEWNASTTFYRFCYSLQKPYMVAMAKLDAITTAGDIDLSVLSDDEWDSLGQCDVAFRIIPGSYAYSDDPEFSQPHRLGLMVESKTYSGGIIGATFTDKNDNGWLPEQELKAVLGSMVTLKEKQETEAKKKLPTKDAHGEVLEILQNYPWMMEYIDKDEFGKQHKKQSFHDVDDVHDAPISSAQTSEDIDSAFDKLIAKRMELGMLNPMRDPYQHFDVKLHGGKWTMSKMGVPFDRFQGASTSKEALQFCKDHNLRASFAANIRLAESQQAAQMLCEIWQHRMMHLLQYALQNGGIQNALNNYIEPETVTDGLISNSPYCQQRLAVIRAIGH